MNMKSTYMAFAAMAMTVSAVCADGPTRYLNRLKQGENYKFYTEDWASVSVATVLADKGCDVTTVFMVSDNIGWGSDFDFNSWTIAPTNAHSDLMGPWCDSTGSVRLRAGGLSIGANDLFRFGIKTDKVRIKLAESQTWRGPASGTVYGQFGIGLGNAWGNYGMCRVAAETNMTWTFDGRIKVGFTASNDLSNVDMVVNPKARLVLMARAPSYEFAAHLNAKSLTLKGGDTESSEPLLTVGAQNPTTYQGTTYAPTAFDDVTFSPQVNLVDGASITGGTFDYGVSALSVSGGDSTISGKVTVKKPVSINIASGASLAFTGTISADVGAGIDLTGGGSLVFTGNVAVPLTGGGMVLCDPGAGETVISGDFSSFTGTIHAASGTVLIHPDAHMNPAATLTAAAGATIRNLVAADFGDYTAADGRTYYRSSDGIAHKYLYMNGFEGNSFMTSMRFRDIPDVAASYGWSDGSVLVVDQKFGGGLGTDDTDLAGMIFTETSILSGTDYIDRNGAFVIGERGIEFRRGDCYLYFWKNLSYLQLSESQSWRGPAAAVRSGAPARINVGGSWSAFYPTGSLTPLKDNLSLTLEGDLEVHLYYPSNDMTRANVTVKAPAGLWLSYPGAIADYQDWVGRLNARQLTFDGAAATLAIEKGSLISPEVLARRIVLANGATFAQSGKSWTGVTLAAAAGSTGYLTGSYTLLDGVTHLEAETGAILDLTGATFLQAAGVSAGFAATGPGTIKISLDGTSQLTGGFAVDGPALELTGSGIWTNALAAASGLTLAASGSVYIPTSALAGYAPSTIAVTSGTLMLDSVAALPAGCKVVTSGTGALSLVDATGFDADTHMGGTQNMVVDPLIVTDAARENETVSVPSGQTLHVFGSGLKSSSSVSLEAGSSLVFYRAATIAAPVSLSGATTIRSADVTATGTFAGAVTAAGECNIYATGGIVFAGGAAITAKLHQRCGQVFFRSKNASISGGSSGYWMYDGYCVITNCEVGISSSTAWYMNAADQTGEVTLEIASGGRLILGNNGWLYVGRSTDFESRLLINGGSFTHGTYDPMYINYNGSGYNGNGRGVVEFVSGRFVSQRRFIVGYKPGISSGYAKFIWRGGEWSTGGVYPYRFYHLFESATADSGIEFSVEGTNCVLDLGNFPHADCISNFNAGASTMVGRPGAKLTVKGKANMAAKLTLANFTPNGMALDLNSAPSADVEIIGDGNPVELGWVVPGTGGVVRCVGTASPLLADYVVPAGVAFENAHVNGDWNAGFASVVTKDVNFWDGSTYLICPTAQGLPPLDISGALVMAGTVYYVLSTTAAEPPPGKGMTLIRAAEGLAGDGVWAAATRPLARKSRIYGQGDDLLFDYLPRSLRINFR